MKFSYFSAKCPFEIGDKVLVNGFDEYKTITDIACINYVKTGTVEFRYELDNNRIYRLMEAKKNERRI